jgi:hypothetical protein
MIRTNHIAQMILTKGFIKSFPLMRGILENLEYEIITTKVRGGSSYSRLTEDIKKSDINDITAINVYINWFKKERSSNYDKITAELVKSKIYAELVNDIGEDIKKIEVNFSEK